MIPTTLKPFRISSLIAGMGFVVLFPGFLFYHWSMAAFGYEYSSFLGGLFGVASAALAFCALVLLPLSRRYLETGGIVYTCAVIGFFIYVFIWTGLHWFLLDATYVSKATVQSLQTIILWFALFFIGAFLPIRSVRLSQVFILSFLVVLFFLLVYAVQTGQAMFYARQVYGVENIASYQGFSRSFLVVLLFLLSIYSAVSLRLVFMGAGAFVLFLFGARSEFYAFLILIIIFFSLFSIKDRHYSIISVISCIGFLFFVFYVDDFLIASRIMEVFDLSDSSSWNVRQTLQLQALQQIGSNPIFGKFGGHIALSGSTGSYSHDALSAWVNYGILGFFWYVLLTMAAFLISFYKIVSKNFTCPEWIFSFSLNFIGLLLITVSKSVFWPLPALGWGVYLCARIEDKNFQKHSRLE